MSDTSRASLSIRLHDGIVASPNDRWARVDLEDHFWLGRCSICNLVFSGDQRVSRLHAIIQRENDSYRFTDMQSMNGSRVNGVTVKSCVLRPGDRIQLGNTDFEFMPQRGHDTVFQDGSSRIAGQTVVTLRSYPCSLREVEQSRNSTSLVAGPKAIEPTMTYSGGDSRPGLPEDAVPDVPQIAVPALPLPDPNVVPPLERFLTIVIDRVVSELKAQLGVIHVPAVGGSPGLALARGFRDGRLGVLEVPPELVARIEKQLPVPIRGADGAYAEIDAILQWKEGLLHNRIKQGDRFPRHSGSGWEMTVPLPRVGRMDTDGKIIRTFDALAWIHVKLEAISPESAYPRVAEVAGGCSASIVRYLERA